MNQPNTPFRTLELGAADVGRALDHWPKFARLHQLKRAGLPVPEGQVLPLQPYAATDVRRSFLDIAEPPDPQSPSPEHRVIARMALSGEDGQQQAFAGLSHSLADLDSNEQLAAALTELHRLTTDKSFRHSLDTYARLGSSTTSSPANAAPRVLVQRQIPRQYLVVLAQQGEYHPLIESHDDRRFDALAVGLSPEYSGALGMWPHPAAGELAELLRRARAVLGSGNFEYECVIDRHDRPWIVQARPLTGQCEAVDPNFIAAIEADDNDPQRLRGLLTLDGDHNPAPLSPAHRWLMHELARQRPGRSGDPIVLAGWLYMQKLPRQLGQPATARGPNAKKAPPSARACLQHLLDQAIPRARRDLAAFQSKIPSLVREDCSAALDEALGQFFAMIDHYVRSIAPARNHYRQYYEAVAQPSSPLTLALRDQFLDVLPCAWDIASPPLSEVLDVSATAPPGRLEIPEGETEAAALLGELDDHFFALGLAPVRAIWLRVGHLAELNRADVFLCTGDEIRAWSQSQHWLDDPNTRSSTFRARAQRQRAQAQLTPPQYLFDGQAVTPLTSPRAICIGNSCSGTWAHRDDLAHLLGDPPAPGAIVHLPTLCAQAALALAHTQVGAVVTSYGGALSHGALMARELGINALIGLRQPFDFVEGEAVELDLDGGTLRARDRRGQIESSDS